MSQEKMLNIIFRLGNRNLNLDKKPLYSNMMPKVKKIVTSVGKDVDKLEPSYTAGSTVS